jgi:hypothetical protein
VGGDPLNGFSPGDSESAKFLDGKLERTSIISATASYELARRLFIRTGITGVNHDGDHFHRINFMISFNE